MSEIVRPTIAPYLRLGSTAGWEPQLGMLRLDAADGNVRLGTPGTRPFADAEPYGSLGGRTLMRGLAIGPDGEVLLADPKARVIRIHRQPVPGIPELPDGQFPALWPARPLSGTAQDPYALVRPTDLAFTPAGDLLIADAGAGRLLVLAYPRAELRRVITLPGWEPVAVGTDGSGRCYVADAAGATVHRFDSRWRRESGYPHPGTRLGDPWQLALAVQGQCGKDPCGIENCGSNACGCGGDLREGMVGGPHPALVVADGERLVLLDERGHTLPADTPVPAVAEPALQPGPDGKLSWADPRYPNHEPLRLDGVVIDRTGRHPGTGLPLVALPTRLRLPQAGVLRLGPLTGQGPGFVWDRLVLDAQIPADTSVLIRTLATDSLPEADLLDEPQAGWSRTAVLGPHTPPEVLVPGQPGLNLWIEIELRGTGHTTPVLRRLDVHAPRRSSLHRLPSSYRQEADSADFLDRFLSYFDTVFAEVQAEHREVARLLDERTAPAGAGLDWLGSWFGLDFQPGWGEATRRRAIAEAMAYSVERGSIPGIRRLLGWHTGLPAPWPAVIEHFRLAPDAPPVGREPLPAPGAAHRCTIVLPESVAPNARERQELEQLLAAQLPAHVRVEVRYIRPGIVVGAQSTIAVDTLLGGSPAGALGTAQLGIDTSFGSNTPADPHTTPHPRSSTPC